MRFAIQKFCGSRCIPLLLAAGLFLGIYPLHAAAADGRTGVDQLLLKARTAVAAGHVIRPDKDNVIYYIDQVFTHDPGNPQAYRLLYSTLDSLTVALESILRQNSAISNQAQSCRHQADLLINRYGLDPAVRYRMDRLLAGKIPASRALPAPGYNGNGRSGAAPVATASDNKILLASWNQLRVIGRF